MPETKVAAADPDKPMIVKTHVTPWGSLVALPFALALAYLGASMIDNDATYHPLAGLGSDTIALLGLLLIAFSLYLFLVGISELACYLKPSVELVMDGEGIVIHGLFGKRRMAWGDLVEAGIRGDELVLTRRASGRLARRTLALPLGRLAIDPKELVRKLRQHRPDLAK
jgi:hypothetical protein